MTSMLQGFLEGNILGNSSAVKSPTAKTKNNDFANASPLSKNQEGTVPVRDDDSVGAIHSAVDFK